MIASSSNTMMVKYSTFRAAFFVVAIASAFGNLSDDWKSEESNVCSARSFSDIRSLIQDFQHEARDDSFLIWFVVVHDDACKSTLPMENITSIAASVSTTVIDIHLLDEDDAEDDSMSNDRTLLQSMGITEIPAMFLVTANKTASYLVPWILSLDLLPLAPSWLNGARGNHSALTENQFVPRQVESLEAMKTLLQESTILTVARRTAGTTNKLKLLACYTCAGRDNENVTMFARKMFSHPELIFIYVEECDRDGDVDVWQVISSNEDAVNITTEEPTHTWGSRQANATIDLPTFLLAVGAPDVLVLSDRLHAAPIALEMDTQAVFLDDETDLEEACALASPLNMACVAVSALTEQRVVTTLRLQPGRLTIVDANHTLYHQPPNMDANTFIRTYNTIDAGKTPPNATFTVHAGQLRWLTSGSPFISPAQQHESVWLAMHPTCGHCQRILPLYRRLGRLLASLHLIIPLYVVNVMDVESGVAVDWVPALVYNRTHHVVLDESFRHEHDLLDWIVQHMELDRVAETLAAVEQQQRK